MLTIAMRLPAGLEAASSTGSTKDVSEGILFSDSLEQAGGLQTSSTKWAPISWCGDGEARGTNEGPSSVKTPLSPLPATKERAEAVIPLSPRGTVSLSTEKEEVSESLSEGDVVRTSGGGGLAKGSLMGLAEDAELASPASSRKPPSPVPTASVAGSDGKVDLTETSGAAGSVHSTPHSEEPVAATPESLPSSPAKLTPTSLDVGDHGADKKVSAGERTKGNHSVSGAVPKEKVVAATTLSPSSSFLSISVGPPSQEASALGERNQQGGAKETDVTYVAAASMPLTPHQAGEMTGGIAAGALGSAGPVGDVGDSSGVAGKVRTKHAEGASLQQTKGRAASAELPAVMLGNIDGAPVAANASHMQASTTEGETLAHTAAVPTLVAQTSLVASHEGILGKTSSSLSANVQTAGRANGAVAEDQDGLAGPFPLTNDAVATTSSDAQEHLAISPVKSEVALVTATTSDGSLDAHLSNGAGTLAMRSIKQPVAGGVTSVRKGAGPAIKATELAASSPAPLGAAPLVGRGEAVAPGHPMKAQFEENNAVVLEDAGSRVAAASSSITDQAPTSPMPSAAMGTTVSAAAPLANVVTQDVTGSGSSLDVMQHKTLQATPTVLEVGVPGGTHGWLKIRAEVGEGGAIRASISSPTKDGEEALHRDLPAMSAYLESERVPVSLQVGHSQALAGGFDPTKLEDGGLVAQTPGEGSGAAMNAGAQQQSQREQPAVPPEGEPQREGSEQRLSETASDLSKTSWSRGDGYAGRDSDDGNWLNVMA